MVLGVVHMSYGFDIAGKMTVLGATLMMGRDLDVLSKGVSHGLQVSDGTD